jgi:hypothetical protein
LEGTECDLFAHCGGEDLGVRILEDQANPGPEASRHLDVFQGVFRDLMTKGAVGSLGGEEEPTENFQHGGFPATVRAEQCDPFTAPDLDRYIVERGITVEIVIVQPGHHDNRLVCEFGGVTFNGQECGLRP